MKTFSENAFGNQIAIVFSIDQSNRNMDGLVDFFTVNYYSNTFNTILKIIVLITFIIGYVNRKKFRILRFLPYYALALLIDLLVLDVARIQRFRQFAGLAEFADYTFTIIELWVFSYFFYNLLLNTRIRKAIVILNVFFLIYFAYMAVIDQRFSESISELTQAKVYTVQGLVLLFFCICYFVELLRRFDFGELTMEPTFWVSAGLLLFILCTLPYSIFESFVAEQYAEFKLANSIYFSFYSLLFFTISKAFLCKPKGAK